MKKSFSEMLGGEHPSRECVATASGATEEPSAVASALRKRKVLPKKGRKGKGGAEKPEGGGEERLLSQIPKRLRRPAIGHTERKARLRDLYKEIASLEMEEMKATGGKK
jgi:hypothetical protein